MVNIGYSERTRFVMNSDEMGHNNAPPGETGKGVMPCERERLVGWGQVRELSQERDIIGVDAV